MVAVEMREREREGEREKGWERVRERYACLLSLRWQQRRREPRLTPRLFLTRHIYRSSRGCAISARRRLRFPFAP